MPGYLLDVTTSALCAHAGKATPTVPMPRVTVMGKPVVTQPAPYVVVGCTFPATMPAAPPPPCVSAAWLTGALRVKAMGQPLLLSDSRAMTAPNGAPVTLLPGQIRVKGI
ncbi:MAG: hypothetical protein ABJE95_08025 [Byssovorax sp.]